MRKPKVREAENLSRVVTAREWQSEVRATVSERGFLGAAAGLWPTHLFYSGHRAEVQTQARRK